MKRFFQQGTALIYTMVFLAIMAFIGITSMQHATLELKLTAHYREWQRAFVAAEGVLMEAEQCIRDEARCSEISGFNSDCGNGLCFVGVDPYSIPSCRVEGIPLWEDYSVWIDTGRAAISQVSAAEGIDGRYIIEFMCYAPDTQFGVTPDPARPEDWTKQFRVTVLTQTAKNKRVMLQSTYQL
ncbi:MAG: pilus assembly PilX family protein [Endozoicomonas sp.]